MEEMEQLTAQEAISNVKWAEQVLHRNNYLWFSELRGQFDYDNVSAKPC